MKRISRLLYIMLIILGMGTFASTKAVLADCPDGTAADDTIICTGDDINGVYGEEGNDTITNNGNTAQITGDSSQNNGSVAGDDTITNNGTTEAIVGDLTSGNGGNDTIVNNGTINMYIVGDGAGNGQGGDDLIINNGVVQQTINGDSALDSGADTITNNGLVGGNILGDSANNGSADIITNTGTVNGGIYGDNADTNPLGGDDTIINSGTVNGIIDGESGNDTITLLNGANGGTDNILVVDGGVGTDVLVLQFDMTDGNAYNQIAAEIAAQSPNGGSISINGQTYFWQNFEELVNLIRYIQTQISVNDDRINDLDLAAPFAVYCAEAGGVKVYDITQPQQGTLAFEANLIEITQGLNTALRSNTPTIIAEAMGDTLWALPSGDLLTTGTEVNEPSKTYKFAFLPTDCDPQTD